MKNILLIAFVSLVWIQCKEEPQKTKESAVAMTDKPGTREVTLNERTVPEKLLTLSTRPVEVMDEGRIDDNLFGKFFCDRASFYIIDNPQNKIYSSDAESITLYCLDGQLMQTRYFLTSNIVTDLLQQLGSFSITGLDFENREIIRSRDILTRVNGKPALNVKLNNYELKWKFGDKEIKYRVDNDSAQRYAYVERVSNYDKEFKAIEKFCI